MRRLQLRVWHFEKQIRGQYHNSPARWSYCGSFRAKSAPEALDIAKYKVGSSLVRIMPEYHAPGDDKGYI